MIHLHIMRAILWVARILLRLTPHDYVELGAVDQSEKDQSSSPINRLW